jgi:epoxyqueuosine reductase
MSLYDTITRNATQLGFTILGVTRAEPAGTCEHYRHWIGAQMHGEMGYMARDPERRCDIRDVWPEVRSVVALALEYSAGEPVVENRANTGIISAYARGDDYHHICWNLLEQLAEAIADDTDGTVSAKGYVDTGSILERDVAERAGLGWHGKNTMLIHPERGSWFFLAELLLDADLPVTSDRSPDRCGTCTRCLTACPTGAFAGPHILDARRCISYLTIEYRGSIPRDLRSLMGTHVFGCDVCQDVCPWNRKAARSGRDAPIVDGLQPRSELIEADLLEFVNITSAEFADRFYGSPILRANRRGFVRNVCVALGNVGDARAIEPLTHALADGSSMVREHAGWALMRIAGLDSVPLLRDAVERETVDTVRHDLSVSLNEAATSRK